MNRPVLTLLLIAALPAIHSHAHTPLTPETVLGSMRKVADWQLAHPAKHPPLDWTQGAWYAGVMALYRVSGDQTYLDAMREMGRNNQWSSGPRTYHADDQVVGQTYCEIYQIDKDPEIIATLKANFDSISHIPHRVTRV